MSQKRDQVLVSQAILNRLLRESVEFLNRLVNMDETWIDIYDPETKEQAKMVPLVKRNQRHRSHQARRWRLSPGTKKEFCF
jgi:hypothetical protein